MNTNRIDVHYVGKLSELRGIHRSFELLYTLRGRGLDVELWALGSWRTDTDEHRADQFIRDRDLEAYIESPDTLTTTKCSDICTVRTSGSLC